MGSAGFGEESQAANRGQHSHGLVPAHFIASSKAKQAPTSELAHGFDL
jgi:hypothetical protein